MSGRRRMITIGIIAVLAALGVGGLALARLYHQAFEQERQRLVEVAQSQARLIEAVARFDAAYSSDYPGGPTEATLSQVRESQERFGGLGETGEFELGRLEGNRVVFLLRDRRDPPGTVPPPIPVDSAAGRPMYLALTGNSGAAVGVDHEGRNVLAAYEPVAVLDLGLVAKVDVAEIRAPFVHASLVVVGGGLLLLLVGSLAIGRLGGPMVRQIETLKRGEREAFDRLRLVLEHEQVGILDVDVPAGRVTLGAEIADMLGEPPGELEMTPSGFLDRVHPDDRSSVAEEFDGSRPGDAEGLDRAFRIRTAGGPYLSVVAFIRPVAWDDGRRPTRLLGTLADVSALQHVRDVLFAREAHLRAAQEMGSIGSWEWENRASPMWWSDELFRVLGAEPDGIPTTPESFYERVHPDDLEEVRALLMRMMEERVPVEAEFRIVVPDGIRWVHGAARPRIGPRGGDWGSIGFLQDVTEEHEMADMLRQAQKMETLGHLTSGIAHDFNNLLTTIQANVGLLSSELDRAQVSREVARQELDEVRVAVGLGADMVRKLMAFSRSTLKEAEVVDVDACLEETRGLMRRLLPESVTLDVYLAHDGLSCRLDPTSLQEILLNLATNARDAMDGRGTLRIETERVTAGAEERLLIRVRDTGCGMDERVMARVFEPFFTTKAPGRGTGLGLAMVWVLTQRQGGEVQLESTLGKGTTFTLSFPGVEGTGPAPHQDEEEVEVDLRGTERILIVEDDLAVRRVGEIILRRYGYDVVAVPDAEAATEILSNEEPVDIVVSDMMLPHMNGIELHTWMRGMPDPPSFLLMSGYGAAVEMSKSLEPEVRFLRKPWGLEDFVRAVRTTLDAASPTG